MGISQYIKEIGRGKDGARSLTREQATDLLGQVPSSTWPSRSVACSARCWTAP